MSERRSLGVWGAMAWLSFPAVPVVLENVYTSAMSLSSVGLPADPRAWGWFDWLIQSGPLLGFAFLAGATAGVPDEPTVRRGPRAWLRRRAVWVAFGPWTGFFAAVAAVWSFTTAVSYLPAAVAGVFQPYFTSPNLGWVRSAVDWTVSAAFVSVCGYGWQLPAVAAVRRARRAGSGWASVRRGVAAVAAFLGSLFGGFWAVTEGWRGYFFDPRVVPALLAAATLGLLCGCSSTITYGELHRRELFHAMLLAWTFGLALLWLWRGRPRT